MGGCTAERKPDQGCGYDEEWEIDVSSCERCRPQRQLGSRKQDAPRPKHGDVPTIDTEKTDPWDLGGEPGFFPVAPSILLREEHRRLSPECLEVVVPLDIVDLRPDMGWEFSL